MFTIRHGATYESAVASLKIVRTTALRGCLDTKWRTVIEADIYPELFGGMDR
jgi:hypothetical protein